MKTEACGLETGPQQVSDNSIFVVKYHKITGYFAYTPRQCDFCGRRITGHDRLEEASV